MSGRRYFQNHEEDVMGFHISITPSGKPYLVDKGQFRNIDHIFMKSGLYVDLPNGKQVKFFVEDKKIKSEIIGEEKEDAGKTTETN